MSRRNRSQFGQLRRLRSERRRARYSAAGTTARVGAPTRFGAGLDAEARLRGVRNDVVGGGGRWRRPDPTTFRGLTTGS